MTKQECTELMNKRGYSLVAEMNGNGTTDMIYSIEENLNSKRFPIPSYSVVVTIQDNSFRCVWAIPYSINKLETPKCSPIQNEKHFDRIVLKFERHCAYIYKFIRES